MKLYRNAIILIVVLGLLIGAYVVVKNKKAGGDTAQAGTTQSAATETKNMVMIDIGLEKAKEVTVEGKGNKLVFEKSGDVWKVLQPTDIKVDLSMVEGLVTEVASLNGLKLIEEKADDLGKYGLNNPQVVVTVKSSAGDVKVLELGNATPLKDAYYAKIKDSDKVYTIGSYTGDRLLKARNSIRDKILFAATQDEVNEVGMERGGKVVFYSKKTGTGNSAVWNVTAPIECGVNQEGLDSIIKSLIGTTVNEFIEENPTDLNKYGLKNPAYTLEMQSSKNEKAKLLLGSIDSGSGNYYAMLDGGNSVFTVASSSFDFLDRPLREIVDPFVYIVSIWDVKQMDVEMDGKTTILGIEAVQDDKEKDKFTVNGKDATMKDKNGDQPARHYYQALIGITVDDIELGTVPKGKPEITFTYHLKKDSGIMKVEFVSKDDKNYYVFRNGKFSNFVVKKKKFDEPDGVRQTYKALMDEVNK